MPVFYDDFERANGSLGGNWNVIAGSFSISGGFAVAGATTGMALDYTLSDSGRQQAIITCGYNGTASANARVLIKVADGDNSGYGLYVSYSSPNYTLVLGKGLYGIAATIASQLIGTSLPFQWTLRLTYDSGHLTAEGLGITLEADDLAYAGGTRAGIYGASTSVRIADFTAIMGTAPAFVVTPNPCGNFGAPVAMSAVGTGTDWTTGTPGAPAFTVDHGTISEQEVTGTGTATFTYDPGDFLGTATFLDPSTGASALVLVSSNPAVVNPPEWSGGLPAAVVEWLQAQADHGGLVVAEQQSGGEDITDGVYVKGAFGELLLGKRVSVGEPGAVPDVSRLDTLWRLINGGYDSAIGPYTQPSATSLKNDLDFLLARWAVGENLDPWTVQQLADALGGEPFASHQDILTAVEGIVGGDNQDVLDAIAAMQGDPLATIKAVLDLVYAIGTTSNYTLDTVRTWIEAARGTGLPTIHDLAEKLTAIQPSSSDDLSTIAAKVVSSSGITAIVEAALLALAGEEGLTLAGMLATIMGAIAELQTASVAVPPAWVDLDHATVGDPLALSDGLELIGPLDGVLVTITTAPARAGRFAFGALNSWRYVGAVVFQTDRGDWEWAQPIGLDSQIVTPRTMVHAAAARLRCEGGWAGTVRPFTVTAPE